MASDVRQLLSLLEMTSEQEELAVRYLQTEDKSLLEKLEKTKIRDKRRQQFAWQFPEAFKKTYKRDPALLRLFCHLTEADLYNAVLVRFSYSYMDFPEMWGYLEKSGIPLDGLVAVACKQLAKLSGELNRADEFLRDLMREQPAYLEKQLQVLHGEQKLLLLMLLLAYEHERFQEYLPLLEAELRQQADFVLRTSTYPQYADAARQYMAGEETKEFPVSSSLPEVTWRLLFRLYPYSAAAKRYVSLLAERNSKQFLSYALQSAGGQLDRSYLGKVELDEAVYERLGAICGEFGLSAERTFAYVLTKSELQPHEYERKLLLDKLDQDPEFVRSSLEYVSKIHYLEVAMLLAGKGFEPNRLRLQKEFIMSVTRSVPSAVREPYREYLAGTLPYESLRETLDQPKHRLYLHIPAFETALLWDVEEAAKREASISLRYGSEYDRSLYELAAGYHGSSDVLEDLLAYGWTREELVNLAVAHCARGMMYSDRSRQAEEVLWTFILRSRQYVMEQFAQFAVDERLLLLEGLAKDNREAVRPLLIQSLGDSSKKVRSAAVELLVQDQGAGEDVVKELGSKKKTVREQAMRILLSYGGVHHELVQEALQEKRNASLVDEFAALLGREDHSSLGVEALCARLLSPQKRAALVQWLGFEPQVRLRDVETIADPILPLAYMQQYLADPVIGKKETAETIREALREEDLRELVQALYQLWISQGADAKKRGVLTLYGLHGNEEMVLLLKKQLDEWALHMRGALAAMAVQALALSPPRLALMLIQSMSFKYKQKQVRTAACEAMSLAAKARGITEEELEDQLVPDLGFNKRGEKTIDYGSRTFTAYLTPELKIELKNEDGKVMKSLPKPNAKDDAALAEAAKEELSASKKQLRSVIGIQTQRLEMALSLNRYWSQQTWKDLFVENPIMQQFAISLIWGEYEEGRLKATFRHMEDGTFNTIEEEEHELGAQTVIGLVHPLELSEKERSAWHEQLEDYEIVQPFLQAARPVFTVAEDENSRVERFGGIELNGRSLLGKMTKFGWSRGSVQDGGVYDSFYKEDARSGIGAELSFSGAPVGYEEEDVCLYDIVFYRAGTVKRGSYEYDEIDEARRVPPQAVPPRMFSEIIYDVSRTAEGSTSRDENWRSKR
ncbi:DUF4132 domain-containing protein [Ectobacillus ponti]|uniref:DUF4132 domain-containing protein n=1 Tax=Ectobacillus ponti TaxID=2961894 RepID=A0AA42BQV0_9BACI|nr:DUF4132 domain-containing protein [Ectobacillus ponti]MCP8969761.1 DUF4132 domain-containing protein [Ectobacillus ponti]